MENVKNTQVPLSNFLAEIEKGVRLKKVDLQSLDSKEQEDPNDLVAILKRAFLSLRGDISGSSVTNDTEVAPEEWQYWACKIHIFALNPFRGLTGSLILAKL